MSWIWLITVLLYFSTPSFIQTIFLPPPIMLFLWLCWYERLPSSIIIRIEFHQMAFSLEIGEWNLTNCNWRPESGLQIKTYFQWIINNLTKKWNFYGSFFYVNIKWNAENVWAPSTSYLYSTFLRKFIIFPRSRPGSCCERRLLNFDATTTAVDQTFLLRKFIREEKSILIAHNNFLLRKKGQQQSLKKSSLSEANY